MNSSMQESGDLKIGMTVYDKYGMPGRIKALEGPSDAPRITVRYTADSEVPKWSTYSITDIGTSIFLSAEESANFITRTKNASQNRISKSMNQRKSLPNLKIENKEKQQVEHSLIKEIEEYLDFRNVTELIHFTSFDNLSTILKHGLLSVSTQEKMGLKSIRSDSGNQLLNFISLSISFPNYLMLWNKLHHLDNKWIMLTINPIILANKYQDVLYCPHNATKYLNYIFNYPDQLKGIAGIQRLFSDRITTKAGEKTRGDLALTDNFTSNPQAEVLVKERISIEYITGILAPTNDVHNEVETLVKSRNLNINSSYSREYFSYRHDFAYWK